MDCPDIETLERLAADGPGADGKAFREHVPACAACQERLELVRNNLGLARRIGGYVSRTDLAETVATHLTRTHSAGVENGTQRAQTTTAPAFPGYEIVREISRGGQGIVYEAIQQSTKRKVALKVLRDGHFADAGERVRFEREVQVLGQLKHPNVVSIYDGGSVGGNAFYVMDYISGLPLDEYVAALSSAGAEDRRRKTKATQDEKLRRVLELFAKICDAVHAAHLKGIIHRDLKPSNIRVDGDGEPHVLDFGLAKLAGTPELSQSPVMTMTGQFLGSLPWSSPEQAEGQPSKIDIRTDVYALGVVLYQLLTGRFPYDVTGNMRDVVDRVLHAEPARLHGTTPPIEGEVETIVLKCLAKERERRYQSAGEVARDLRHHLVGEAIEARRDSVVYISRKTLWRWRGQAAEWRAKLAALQTASQPAHEVADVP